MDRPFDIDIRTQTQPEMGGPGGGGKTRIGLGGTNPWDDSVPGNLATRVLHPSQVVPFLRELEQAALSNVTKPVFIYFSTHSASRLLPTGPTFQSLLRDAYCVSIFSEDMATITDVSIMCVFSEKGSAFIEMREMANSISYKCFGSIDANMTVQRMKGLFDRFRSHDLAETNRLVEMLQTLPFNSTNMNVFGPVYRKWMNQ